MFFTFRQSALASIWLVVLAIPFQASATSELYDFISGSYSVVGKLPDSAKTYSGTVRFEEANGSFRVVRTIQAGETTGIGKIETALHGEAKVLRVRFREQGKDYEATYLIDGDLDNYARLSGYVYLSDGSTKKPGLEALFADR